MHAIHYWYLRIKLLGIRDPANDLLNYYVSKSDVEISVFDHDLPINYCIHQINNTRAKLKDVITQATQLRSEFEVDLATAAIKHKHEQTALVRNTMQQKKISSLKKNLRLGRIDKRPRNHGAIWDDKYGAISNPTH
jgi:hypothetical protein